MKYIWYLLKKVNLIFILYSTEIQKAHPNFLPGHFSFNLTFLVFIGYNTRCKHSLHLENGLESYFKYEMQEISI